MNNLNERARHLIDGFSKEAGTLACEMFIMPNGAVLLDAGVLARGGLLAGVRMAEIGTAGLAKIRMISSTFDDHLWPAVEVLTDHPLEACLLSQAANWPIEMEGFRAMGSGPACLLNKSLKVGLDFGYEEYSQQAMLVLEGRQMPNDPIITALASDCGVTGIQLAMIIAPTSSLAGSVQIAARSVETALHKLHQLGFDVRKVVSGVGVCPIAPPSGDDLISLGKTNDAMMFGSRVWLAVDGIEDEELNEWVKKIPASSSPGYGEPFLETLKKAGDFYKIDPGLFAPAEITLSNLSSGKVMHAGEQDIPRLIKSVLGGK